MFELKVGEKVINLKWGTYAMKLLCERTGNTLDGFFALLGKMADNPSQQDAFDMLQAFIHAGYEYANKAKVTDEEVCEWIDEMGGIINVNNGQMVDYINYVVKSTMNGVTPLPGDTPSDDKKKG